MRFWSVIRAIVRSIYYTFILSYYHVNWQPYSVIMVYIFAGKGNARHLFYCYKSYVAQKSLQGNPCEINILKHGETLL